MEKSEKFKKSQKQEIKTDLNIGIDNLHPDAGDAEDNADDDEDEASTALEAERHRACQQSEKAATGSAGEGTNVGG